MKLQLKRSLRLDGGAAQAPSADQMGYGELAINYSQEDPCIFLKDSTNVVRKLRLSLLPDATNASVQAGTLDERYLKLDGGTMTGTLNGTEFVGGVARVSATAPESAGEAELWFNSSNGRTYIRYSGQWVDASPDSFTMGTDFYSKPQTDTEISTAVSALSDGAVATNTSGIAAVVADLDTEEAARAAADTTLQSNIDAEETARIAAVADVQAAVDAEETARAAAVSGLASGAVATNASAIATLQTELDAEEVARANAVSGLASGAVANNTAAIEALQSGLSTEESTRLAAVSEKMNIAGGTFTGPVSFNAGIYAKGDGIESGRIQLNCQNNSHGIKIAGPAHSAAADYTLTLPTNTGTNGQFLTTDGSGTTSWTTAVTDLSAYATNSSVDTKIAGLIDSAPGALNTLNELAAAMGDDANFATTVTNALATKANTSSLATVATSGAYSDLSGRPSIPTVNNKTITLRSYGQLTNASSTFTLNQSSSETITLPQIRYSDLSGKPSIPTVNNKTITLRSHGSLTNASSTFTLNQSSNETITLPQIAYGDLSGTPSLATVATSGSYTDLSNKPSIPSVNNATITIRSYGHHSNANSTFSVNQTNNETITLPQIRYTDLSGKPSIPAAANNGTITIKQNGTSKGSFTVNQSGNTTIELTDTDTNTNTTYSAGTGLSLSGTSFYLDISSLSVLP